MRGGGPRPLIWSNSRNAWPTCPWRSRRTWPRAISSRTGHRAKDVTATAAAGRRGRGPDPGRLRVVAPRRPLASPARVGQRAGDHHAHGHPPLDRRQRQGAYQYFRGSTSIESTFIVKKNGYFWQIMSLGEQADANFRANAFAGSIETEDNGNPDADPGPRPSWTPWSGCPRRCAACAPRSPAASAAPGPTPPWLPTLFPGQWTNVPGLLALDTPVPTPDGLVPLRTSAGGTVFGEHGQSCRVTANYERPRARLPPDVQRRHRGPGRRRAPVGDPDQRPGHRLPPARPAPRPPPRPQADRLPRDWASRWGSVRTTDDLAATLRTLRGGYVHNIPLAAPSSSPRSTSRSTRISSAPGSRLDGEPVPLDYLYGSESQRLAPLQGPMDTGRECRPGRRGRVLLDERAARRGGRLAGGLARPAASA